MSGNGDRKISGLDHLHMAACLRVFDVTALFQYFPAFVPGYNRKFRHD
jgi:hypothetical protein